MIGDGWDDQPAMRPDAGPDVEPTRARIAIITGTRAEFGLLAPVMDAVARNNALQLLVIAAGSHLVLPAQTFHEVKARFKVAGIVPMQVAGRTGRAADVQAVGSGVGRFGREFTRLQPACVVVLGDRVEAFAAAAAASIGGYAVAHIHGGDRAEGVADEAMRHAITKLAHIHFPATEASVKRIIAMGEDEFRVHRVGSPAIDAIASIGPVSGERYEALGSPTCVLLHHPVGGDDETEEANASAILDELEGERVLALMPNLDAGRAGIARAIKQAGVRSENHLPREEFVGLLRWLAVSKGVLLGNSSAALIEAAAVGVRAVDIGPRQAGRERCANVVHIDSPRGGALRRAIASARALDLAGLEHPYGDGRAGERIAAVLARTDFRAASLLRKRNAY
ncbi:MAG TPA: UDP-N-acetylglucosamine 2-epimerase [Phycisphaerales bacterium]|nr:UDP-N-acetylglucosamine 2-epimerase [Phycisphaerales bacterium]